MFSFLLSSYICIFFPYTLQQTRFQSIYYSSLILCILSAAGACLMCLWTTHLYSEWILNEERMSCNLLKACSNQLAGVYCHLFNHSLAEHSILSVWKSSTICPVPKKGNHTCDNDYRPVALTSLVMKGFERLILAQLQAEVSKYADPLQFEYKHHRGVEDGTLTLLHGAYSHL